MSSVPYIGEILSIASALFWGIAVILFKLAGDTMSPIALNAFKNAIAVVLLTATLVIAGVDFWPSALSAADWALLFASGVVGISIADPLFFLCLEKLGAGLTAVVATSYTPIILCLSVGLLGERLTPFEITGAALIMSALLVGSASRPEKGRTRRDIVVGSIVGVVGIGLMAVAIVAIKGILNRPETDMLWATWVRLLGGFVGVLPLIAFHPRRRALVASLRPTPRSWMFATLAALFGTYLAMTTWIGGMKYCEVSRAALLNQLSTIFIFLFATVFLKERLTWRRGIAIALAAAGAYFIMI
jgi:drug/metabolite transporter (DMT)-like permease